MDTAVWSRCAAEEYFQHHDPERDLQQYRTFIPRLVLNAFCNPSDQNVVYGYDQNLNSVPMLSEAEVLTLYNTVNHAFQKQHYSQCFGAENLYQNYFESLTQQVWKREGFRKFEMVKRVDQDLQRGLMDSLSKIRSFANAGAVALRRDEVNLFRKFAYLLTSLQGKDKTMHTLAHDPSMEDARQRRRRHMDSHGMEHPRDVWLRNAEEILETPHHAVVDNTRVFDLDREDYHANARERFMVFWEAPAGQEFVLTDGAFGTFEGGKIGAKKNSSINMNMRELEKHTYTREYMWHQLFVLSPTLVVALCHPTLMHPDLMKMQRKRWGLRRSLLENLPHALPEKYYKDMRQTEMSFHEHEWRVPSEVEKAFAPSGKKLSIERANGDEILFPVHELDAQQVGLVNSVLLHNQERGPQIKSVCIRLSAYASLQQALMQFRMTNWSKFSEEQQNDYNTLIEHIAQTVGPLSPQELYSPMHLPGMLSAPSSVHTHSMPTTPMYDPRRPFGDMVYTPLSATEIPRYEQTHALMDVGRPGNARAHSTNSAQSSLTSAFTPSSQSSYSLSSASSQSSGSTKTTSIDTPRFEPKHFQQQQMQRRPEPSPPRVAVQRNGSHKDSKRGSDTSAHSHKVKPDNGQPQKMNITIEHVGQGLNFQEDMSRGRQPPATRSGHTSAGSSKKPSPEPPRGRVDQPFKQLEPPPKKKQTLMGPPPVPHVQHHASALPERPMYVPEPSRPSIPERSWTEHQQNGNRANGHSEMPFIPEHQIQQTRRANRSPERPPPRLEQPPRRQMGGHALQERQPSHRSDHSGSGVRSKPHSPERRPRPLSYHSDTMPRSANRSQERATGIDSRLHLQEPVRPMQRTGSQKSADSSSDRHTRGRQAEPEQFPSRSTNHSQERRPVSEDTLEWVLKDSMRLASEKLNSGSTSANKSAQRSPERVPSANRSANRSPERVTLEPSRSMRSVSGSSDNKPPVNKRHSYQAPPSQPAPTHTHTHAPTHAPKANAFTEKPQPVEAHRHSYQPAPQPQTNPAHLPKDNGFSERPQPAENHRHSYQPLPQNPPHHQQTRQEVPQVNGNSEKQAKQSRRQSWYGGQPVSQQPAAVPPQVPMHVHLPQKQAPVEVSKPAVPHSQHSQGQNPAHQTSAAAPRGPIPAPPVVVVPLRPMEPEAAREEEPEQRQAPSQAHSQPRTMPSHEVPQQQASNGSSSSTRPIRAGVEFVHGRSYNGNQQADPQQAQPTQQAPMTPAKQTAAANVANALDNPVLKQLRFESPVLGHKGSDVSLAGSMIVHAPNTPTPACNDDDDDDASWEDEGFAEAEEIAAKPRKPTVRFADRPHLSRNTLLSTRHMASDESLVSSVITTPPRHAAIGKHIQRPGSGLARRVEIPRPLSRNGQRGFEARPKPRHTHMHRRKIEV